MGNKILKLENHRPFLTIPLIDGNVLVIPAFYFESIIAGDQKILPGKSSEMLLRTIIKEWYKGIKNQSNT